MSYNSYYRSLPFLLLFFLTLPAAAESILEFHQRQCHAGKQSSCQRVEVMREADAQAKRIEQLGDAFAARIDRRAYETQDKPELAKAYVHVMQDFFKAEQDKGIRQTITDDMLLLCAGHYEDYWRNQKLWWPTDSERRPDWSTIYYYIVDHYYGYCARSFLSGASNS